MLETGQTEHGLVAFYDIWPGNGAGLLFQRKVAVLCSGNALVLINAVALHRARLVLGWVTAFG